MSSILLHFVMVYKTHFKKNRSRISYLEVLHNKGTLIRQRSCCKIIKCLPHYFALIAFQKQFGIRNTIIKHASCWCSGTWHGNFHVISTDCMDKSQTLCFWCFFVKWMAWRTFILWAWFNWKTLMFYLLTVITSVYNKMSSENFANVS